MELGVVDPNGRMFDVPNLYVAGSSVFPSTGHANLTFTIVAMAIRLAEHLSAGRTPTTLRGRLNSRRRLSRA